MDFKNAVAVCLIALFSATLVVLIARTLDSQAAARLEPQLAEIVKELHLLRTQGGVAAVHAAADRGEAVGDGLVVYYFHGNIRCPTCQAIESQAHETVQAYFAPQLDRGEMTWKVANYEQGAAKPLAEKFEVQMPVVVVARMRGGQVDNWSRLDKVWPLVGDKTAFTQYVRGEIERLLAVKKPAISAAPQEPLTNPIPQ